MKHALPVVQLVLVLAAAACLPACHAWRPEPGRAQVSHEPLRPAARGAAQTPRERFFFNEKSQEIEESLGL
ncbi:MAG: hypothetical protein MUF48_01145 [Pirellulaceae bacterium]|jgi:hypothetical protein|nr:hypothetical protein [Pirellulaceae bacterium]